MEGLADLIHAETEAQRKQALRQMEVSAHTCIIVLITRVSIISSVRGLINISVCQGDLGSLYAEWTQRLLKVYTLSDSSLR